MSKEATAEKKQQEPEEMVECPRQGLWETAITHPLRHLASPGVGNKIEAVFSTAGRVFAGYGIYRGGKYLYRLIAG